MPFSNNLVDILQELYKRRKFILIFTLCAVLLGILFSLIQKKEYTSKSTFIVKSMAVLDRSHIFRKDKFLNEDYFASVDDIDHVITMGKSNTLRDFIVTQFHLEGSEKNNIKKNLKFTRNANKNFEIAVSNPSPEVAQNMAQSATDKLEDMVRDYFLETQQGMVNIIQDKITGIDQTLKILEDSILSIRNKYQIFDQLLPVRNPELVTVVGKSSSNAEGMEVLQKFTSQKDKLVKDRDDYYSMLNENADLNKEVKLFYRVEHPKLEEDPSWPKIPIILLVSFLSGLLFSSFLVLLEANVSGRDSI